MDNWLVRARMASGLTREQCAAALRTTMDDYVELEEYPGRMTINELAMLCRSLNPAGRKVVRDVVGSMARGASRQNADISVHG